MSIAKQLKSLLKEREISVGVLAKKTGISSKTLYHYLEGRTPRNMEHVKAICTHFGVSADYLLFGYELTSRERSDIFLFGRYEVFMRRIDDEPKR